MVTRALRRLVPGSIASSLSSPAFGSSPGSPAGETVSSPGDVAPSAGGDGPLDVCLLSYRSNPYSGGQGVYVANLSRALVERGHAVTVISGAPYPDLDPRVDLVKLPGENIIERENRLGAFELEYLREPVKLYEWASVLSGGFPEPYAFGRRVVDYFEERDPDFDVVHDNQSLCYGLLELRSRGIPTVATVHHPITVDRDLALEDCDGLGERLLTRRWYRFLAMQARVARRLPHVITVSRAAKRRTVADFGVSPESVEVVHNGIDAELFAPRPDVERDPARLITTVSADVPLKGARYLLEAFARVRRRRPELDPELHVVGEFDEGGSTARRVGALDLEDAVTTHAEISYDRLVELYAGSALAVAPSLYEGFGLPAGEAMACGVPVVATTGGGLSEVVGDAGRLVEPGDAAALADAICEVLSDPELRRDLGRRGRERVRERFDWDRAARETVSQYRRAIATAG